MGNCQAIDAATLVIQHPNGKIENLYWPVSASEVMKTNPGHYVALLLSTTLYDPTNNNGECPNNGTANNNSLRVTRIKLLRPTDTLVLGHVYRLITTQEVTKGLWAKKQAKLKKNDPESEEKPERVKEKQGSGVDTKPRRSEQEKKNQVTIKKERNRPRATTSANSAAIARSRAWQPSLRSILEAGSGS
ncbi:hypothetical protein D5086_028303 [Populus alba]|uniref:DUF4228 domain-containing protein n=2 Tax=Populus alba TaxID=43335 RepID=A0A4V6ACD5_POPAL|nr:uncharacterized protein LOC118033432 [Populus alba]TKS16036.1 uncharacterized protein D5086_0000026090 [Populus alba]